MKNFISRIECVVEPAICFNDSGKALQITMRCRTDNKEWSITKIEDTDFMVSHFDLIFDHMREDIRHSFLKEVNKQAVGEKK